MIELPSVATRVDAEGKFREEITFFEVNGTRIFSVLYRPVAPATIGLVVCPPILMEHIKNYRYEVLLARALAARGIAVHRFHYRGTGHSDGEESAGSDETMVEDTLAAVRRLREQMGVSQIALHGTRWGARVAALAAAESALELPMSFWEPIVDGARYFRELVRARLIRQVKDPRFADAATDGWMEEMARDGRLDILGYPLYRKVYESGRGSRLDQLLGARPCDVLLVQLTPSSTVRPDVARLKQAVESAGGSCEVRIIKEEPGWMFVGHRLKSADKLISVTAEWIVNRAGRDARA